MGNNNKCSRCRCSWHLHLARERNCSILTLLTVNRSMDVDETRVLMYGNCGGGTLRPKMGNLFACS
jgi:hypothetical protein